MNSIRNSISLVVFLNITLAAVFFGPYPGFAAFTSDTHYYTVVEGDCLWLIANKFNTSVEKIKTANGLNSDLLRIGQTLAIPGKDAYSQLNACGTSLSSDSVYYTVVEGDCLWLIANKFNTSVEKIKTANGLNSDLLRIGQTLAIPGRAVYQPTSRGTVSRAESSSAGTSGEINKAATGELISWPTADKLFPRGSTAILQDFETGRQFKIYRLFGTNHADCEPLTASDSLIMKECFGGQWSWERRAAILLVNGRAIACSMAGMPHGTSQKIFGNDFDGHFDLHFLNSRTHGTNRVDPDHQAAVHRAAGK